MASLWSSFRNWWRAPASTTEMADLQQRLAAAEHDRDAAYIRLAMIVAAYGGEIEISQDQVDWLYELPHSAVKVSATPSGNTVFSLIINENEI